MSKPPDPFAPAQLIGKLTYMLQSVRTLFEF